MKGAFLKNAKAITAAVLAAAVLFLNATPAYAGYYADTADDHKDVTYEQMKADHIYDYEVVEGSIKALVAALDISGNDVEVEKLYREMLAQLDNAVTANALANVEFYADVANEAKQAAVEEITLQLVDLGDMANSAVSKMVEGEYRYIVEKDIGDAAADFEGYVEMTDEEKALLAREENLENQYELYAADETMDDDTRYQTLAAIYIELVKIRKEMMNYSDDYTTYREYAYESIYGRDYTVTDADYYHQYVKQNVTGLFNQVTNKIVADIDTYYELWDRDCGDLSDILAIMEKHLGDIDPELKVSFNYFVKNHTYYIENSSDMVEAGYTTRFYTYNTPFIYNALYGNFYDYTDVFHEFGHYNQMFHDNTCAMYSQTSYDVAEIHSQTMELFFLEWAEECYGKDLADMACLFTMYRMLDNVISGSLQDEFQAEAFKLSDEELTADKLAVIYKNLLNEYGRTGSDPYTWVEISHSFTSPFYYISYSTSAMGALQIYQLSKEDRAKAIDIYMKLTTLTGDIGYCEAVESVGLQNIMAVGVVEKVCKGLEAFVQNPSGTTGTPTATPTPEPTLEPGVEPTAAPAYTPAPTNHPDNNVTEAEVLEAQMLYEIVRTVAITVAIGGVLVIVICTLVLTITHKRKGNKNGEQ